MTLKEQIQELDDVTLVELHNDYSEHANSTHDCIHRNDEEFFELYFSKAIDAIRACHFGDYEYHHDFVQFNGYANLESFNNPSKRVDFDELTEYVRENDEFEKYELQETRFCEITDEELDEGYYFEHEDIWIKTKDNAIAHIQEHYMDDLEKDKHEDLDDLLQDAYDSEVYCWTTV